MQALLKLSAGFDGVLTLVAGIAKWAGLLLVITVCYDVLSRYFGVPKPFGLNSTMVQEAEYWLHSFFFTMLLGYAFIKGSHVRIDLLREKFSTRGKYVVELLGLVLFLLPFVSVSAYYSFAYTYSSFLEGEISKSIIGLPSLWILKSTIPVMFVLIGIAGLSHLIKVIAGLAGQLPPDQAAEILGEEL
jgi:TRAP-type mannitol/chloroaromatic compound transport system permease small subunit